MKARVSLIEALFDEMDRVRQLTEQYETKLAGRVSANMMKATIKKTETAIDFGDTVEMIRLLNELESYTA